MKKILEENNLGFKLLAFCIAFLLWVVVVNIEDPVEKKIYKDIPVEILNEDAIQSLDQVYEVVSGNTVNITVKAKRSLLKMIKASDLKATADLSEAFNYAVPIKTSCPKYAISENVETMPDISVMKISLEPVATEQFKVTVDMGDTVPGNGYAIGSVVVKPNMIKVSGAKSQIERISEVRVKLDVSNVSEDFVKRLEPLVYDANGKQMDSANMKFSSAEVKVSVKVLETKVIPINISTTGTPAPGFSLLATEYQPQTIEISGSAKDLEKIEEIPVKIDISGKNDDVEKTIDLTMYLPKGVNLAGTENTVTIKLVITQKKSKDITFYPKDIQIKNKSDNMILSYEKENTPLVVRIIGTEEEIRDVTVASLKPYINIEHLEEGIHTLEIKFEGMDSESIIVSPSISFSLKAIGENSPVSEEPVTTAEISVTPGVTEEPLQETEIPAQTQPSKQTKPPKETETPAPAEEGEEHNTAGHEEEEGEQND